MIQNIFMEQVKVPAEIGSLRVLRKFVDRIGKKYRLSASELYAFKASVDEACTNIIEHGYGFKDGSITIKAIVRNESLTIELFDYGKSFDPKQVKKPDLHSYVDTRKKGGLGIFIIRTLVDEVDYQTTNDGNILRLTKYRQTLNPQDMVVPLFSLVRRIKNFFSLTRTNNISSF